MSYTYSEHRPYCFTEEGSTQLLEVLSKAQRCIELSGAVLAGRLLIGSGDSWNLMALVDRLVEIGKLRYVKLAEETFWQDQVLVVGSAGLR